jgi:hypothetical protein
VQDAFDVLESFDDMVDYDILDDPDRGVQVRNKVALIQSVVTCHAENLFRVCKRLW